ncbi:extracellular solute-binding protein [Paenibacillus sp. CC-CFT747]|nr:extracellular solute-binding protein [Paenibacillus sp. CC-CFT747]
MVSTKRLVKWTSTASAIVLAASALAGCGSKETGGAAGSGTSPNPSDNAPLKITMMADLHTPEVPSDEVLKALEEKTNARFTVQWVPDGNYDEKFQAALATGSLPQVAWLKNAASVALVRSAIESGQFWEVGPYLKDYKNLSKLNGNTLNNTKINGKIYSLYQERDLARSGVIYRKDWADKLGIAEPKTTDDLYTMLKKFKEADLGGGGNTIGLADRNDLVYGSFKALSSWFGTPNNWGVENGKLVPDFMTKGYLDTMKFLKKLYSEGLINKDFPVTSKADQQNLMYTGKAGVYIGNMPDVKTMQEKTVKNVPGAQFDVTNTINGPDGKPGLWSLPGYGSLMLFPKSSVKTEADLKKLLAVFDKFFDPEVADLLKYGIEGKHYTKKDGKVVPDSDVKKLEKEATPYLGMALADTTNITPSFYTLPVMEKANTLVKAAEKFAIADPAAPLASKTAIEKGNRLQDIIKDGTYQFILGKIDEKGFQDVIKKWQDQGGAQIISEYNAEYAKGK